MQFGYFTLSDTAIPTIRGRPRLHQGHLCRGFVRRDDRPELGLDRRASFQPLGVNASPLAILAQLAGATTKLRLRPP